MGWLVATSTMRPRAVRAVWSRANTGKSSLRLSSMSRTGPSTITPATPRTCAPIERFPPHDAASKPVCCSTTMMSPGEAASIAAVHRWRVFERPSARSSLTVNTRPAILCSEEKRRIPVTAPCSPNLSKASETAQESSRLSRDTNSSILSFWPPAREAPLQTLRHPGEQDSRKRHDQYAHEQRVSGEGLSSVGHHEADPLASAEHFAHHHADQSQRDSLAYAGQDERHRSG